MTNACVCTVHTAHVPLSGGLMQAIETTHQPTSQPTGFIITRWHRAIRAGQSLTSVKHVGIIARNKGFL